MATAAYLEGLAKPVRLDSAFGDGGLDAQTRGVESVLGISTTASQAVERGASSRALLEPYAPVEVTFDTPVLETASNGSTREVISAGEHRLTAREAAQVAAGPGGRRERAGPPAPPAGGVDGAARSRRLGAAAVDHDSDVGGHARLTLPRPTSPASSRAVTSGPVGVHTLRVEPSFDPSAPSGPELLQADVGYLRLLVATVMPGAVSPSNGNISFRIVNPLGDVDAAYQAVARLAAVQANVVLVTDVPGPAPEHTTIVYQSPAGETQAAAFAPVLGAATPTASAERIDGVDATVTLGQDFPAFLDSQAAKSAATTTAAFHDRRDEHVDGRRSTSTTTKRTTLHDDQEGQRLSIRHDDSDHATDTAGTGPDPVRSWALLAARTADDKQGRGTVILEVGSVLAITDYFVVTSGRNARQVRTIAEEVERAIKEAGGPGPLRVEGLSDLTWVLLDYGDVVVHVFDEETRRFYDIERLYRDVPVIEWAETDRHSADQAGVGR